MKDQLLNEIIVIRLPSWMMRKLENIAKSKGLRTSTLARMWLAERLAKTRK